jgi:predicted outer membrane repeat protein
LTWETAFLHVQDALGVASYGDEIWVAEGTYKPDSNAANPTGTDDSNATFALVGGAAMYGGFPSGGGEWDDRDPEQYQTILSGDINTPDDANDNSYHVVSATLVDSNTILDGFVITAGNAMGSSYPNDRGGGMWIYNNADPGIANCVFTGNEADYYGGGMTISAGSPTVDNCLFANNSAESIGGGMVITHDNYNAVITNCTFRDNSAGVWGGAIYGGGLMVNCRFLGNASNYGGAAFLLDFSGAEWVNCIFSGNSAIYDGGAFRSTVFSSPALANCTFSGNSAGGNGGAISSDVNCHPVLTNCILWGNTATNGEQIYNGVTSSAIVSYSDVQDGYTGIGNISEDPLFSDANGDDDTAGTQDDNLRLSAASPCIDLGDNNSVPPDGTDQDGDGNRVEPTPWDLDGRDRIVDGDCNDTEVVDMGAYEFSYAYIGDFDDDCDVDLRDFSIFALAWLSGAGDGQYNPDCDISLPPDEFIDWRDLRLVGDNWLAGK